MTYSPFQSILPVLLAATLGSCVINQEQYPLPDSLAEQWLVDRPRVLAVTADPPEIRPGHTAHFQALIAGLGDEAPSVLWFACPPDDEGGIGFGCAFDLEGIDLNDESFNPQELEGLIGFEPFLPPTYTAPESLLEGLDEQERSEGVYVLVEVALIPPDTFNTSFESFDFNDIEAAYKRLVVSESPTPNNNPEISALKVFGYTTSPDQILYLDGGSRYDIEAMYGAHTVETYEYLNRDGEWETRVEEPYLAWYATGGEILDSYSLYPDTTSKWIAPESGTSGSLWAVIRDRRGGMSWITQPFQTQ